MDEFFLTKDISIELSFSQEPFSEIKFLFGSDGSIAAAGKILTQPDATLNILISETKGSEHWFSEKSDFFRFYESGQLHSLILRVPEENALFNGSIPQPREEYCSIKLSSKSDFFIVPPQLYRSFDPLQRELYCFTEDREPETVFKITPNLSLTFDKDKRFCGWIFYYPLENITNSFQGEKDRDVVDEETYMVFADYFDILSDNEVALCDDDFEIVVKKLISKIDAPRISKIKGNIRRELFEKAVFNLKDYFLET